MAVKEDCSQNDGTASGYSCPLGHASQNNPPHQLQPKLSSMGRKKCKCEAGESSGEREPCPAWSHLTTFARRVARSIGVLYRRTRRRHVAPWLEPRSNRIVDNPEITPADNVGECTIANALTDDSTWGTWPKSRLSGQVLRPTVADGVRRSSTWSRAAFRGSVLENAAASGSIGDSQRNGGS
jgi:hypothetical protein